MRNALRRAVPAAAGLLALTACGTEVPDGLIVTQPSAAPATPYSGPLKTKTPEQVGEDSPLEGGGAALLALECAGRPSEAGSFADEGPGDDGAGSAAEALARHLANGSGEVPDRGYRVEARRGHRVLYSHDVAGRTRAAVIVAEDRRGWFAETHAACDPSEFRARDRARLSIMVWQDTRGRAVSTAKVVGWMGAEHCDWQSVEFVTLGSGDDGRWRGRQYLRDPEGKLAGIDGLSSTYAKDVPLPADAVDTGYRQDGRELWLAPDKSRAYVRDADKTVERWPGRAEPVGCK
ncbi:MULTISPECIES: hypothetical protein [unclassified Streptomyces]|uniref:hypothetical protein n=1 Tax=unclassified Streptomyces TaxID=2593676 RepID=UPI000DBAC882|nr:MULTISPECIES: hypothetical protein [unclassified Streptomyces]MYT74401.1 hypothetical protein [Streptomyces sp. SID8367]RAJ91379.1 hypothetical protein K377_00144 [Streptomyces sp. PsTaAH-137]